MSAIATATGQNVLPPPLFKPASVKPREVAAVPALSSLPINEAQCEKALKALLAHVAKVQEKREQEDLLGEQEEKVFLVVGLKKAPKREIHKPIRLLLPNPVIDPRTSPVTLFVKDPQRTYKDLMVSSKINFISRVVGLDKLRTKHKTFEAKRALLKEADLFLVDDRVTVEVGKSVGKMWREAKKQPIPVAIARKDLKAELERAVAATYLQVGTGTNLSIKVGSTAIHTPAQLSANLLALIPQLAVRIPDSPFSNIQSLHIKTSTSISLPIYNTTLDGEGRFSGPSKEETEAIDKRAAEKEAAKAEQERKEQEREERRKERSATREGKGRAEKKRKAASAASDDGEEKVVVEEVEIPVTEPIAEAEAAEAAPPAKKAKKAKKEAAAPVEGKKSKKAAK